MAALPWIFPPSTASIHKFHPKIRCIKDQHNFCLMVDLPHHLRLLEDGPWFRRHRREKGSGITSIKDLAGKKVAVNRGGTGEYLLMQGLETNGVDPESVERIYLSPSDSGPSFTQGHVDAWATWDPFLTIAEKAYDGKVVGDGAAIKSDNAVVLVASRDFAKSKADQLQLVFDVIKSENA
jgi:ABC-type amino acid transport substrate-binding protein